MALPAGVSTATLTVGVPVTFSGGPVKSIVSITPSVFLVHTETGTPLVDMVEEVITSEGVAGQFVLPHTDQSGFQDENGNAYENWYYTATIQYQNDKVTRPPKTKVFQLATGQATVDLDKLPGGAPALPFSASVPTVTSVDGLTGSVNLAGTYATKVANSLVGFGDSLVYFNYGDPVAYSLRPSPASRGYISNGNVMLGHRFGKFINKGIGGQDTLALLARMQTDLVDVDAGWALIASGTNDITNGRSLSTVTTNLATLYQAASDSGKRVIGVTVPPRTGATTAQKLLRSQINQWIRGQAVTRPGFIVVDLEQAVMDPLTNDFVTGYSYDGVHLANPGGIAGGEAFANALRNHVPAAPILLAAADPNNLLANNGGGFPGAASAIPTGWTANGWSQGAPTYSKVARTDGIPGQWQQLVVPTDSRGFLRSTNLIMSNGAFVSGDVIQAAVEFQVENLEVAPTLATQALYITIEFADGGTTTSRHDLEYNASENENEGNRARSGILLTAPLTIPSAVVGAQTLSMTIQARCGGTYKFARACMFKV